MASLRAGMKEIAHIYEDLATDVAYKIKASWWNRHLIVDLYEKYPP